jgi:hypothetical protein
MPDAALPRLIGLVAIVAGLLRAADAFAFRLAGFGGNAALFLVTDILLVFAIVGLYARLSRATGWLGLAGFAVAVVGIVLARGAGDNIDADIRGTAILAAGMAMFGLSILIARDFPIWPPVLWIAALLAGAAGFWTEVDWTIELASIAFGLGFVLAGAEIFRRAA